MLLADSAFQQQTLPLAQSVWSAASELADSLHLHPGRHVSACNAKPRCGPGKVSPPPCNLLLAVAASAAPQGSARANPLRTRARPEGQWEGRRSCQLYGPMGSRGAAALSANRVACHKGRSLGSGKGLRNEEAADWKAAVARSSWLLTVLCLSLKTGEARCGAEGEGRAASGLSVPAGALSRQVEPSLVAPAGGSSWKGNRLLLLIRFWE